MKQYTFMMLKPDAFQKNAEKEVVNFLEEHDLHVEESRIVNVDMEIMKVLLDHYHGVIDEMPQSFNYTGKMFNTFYYGKQRIMPMIVSYEGNEDVIAYSRKLVGATNPANAEKGTIRNMFSDDNYDKAGSENRLVNNVIHASDSKESAEKEIELWKKVIEK